MLRALAAPAGLHRYLFSHHWLDLGDLLRTPVGWVVFVANGRLRLGTSPSSPPSPGPG